MKPAKRPPSPGNVPISISRGVPVTIRVNGLTITITQEQDHEKVHAGSKIQA
jgi:hypothetical protein